MCVFIFFNSSSVNRVTAYWEIAAHSAYDMFSKYKYLVSLVFPASVFGVGISFWSHLFLIIAYWYLSIILKNDPV